MRPKETTGGSVSDGVYVLDIVVGHYLFGLSNGEIEITMR